MDRLAHILNRRGMERVRTLMKEKRHHVPMYNDNIKDKIINLVSDYYRADVEDVINSNTRLRKIVMAKYMSMYIISRDFPELKDQSISDMFNTHRTTFLYAKNKIKDFLEFDKQVIDEYNDLRKRVDNLYE
jgi:chromosomal replication initiation ATPase DnaA